MFDRKEKRDSDAILRLIFGKGKRTYHVKTEENNRGNVSGSKMVLMEKIKG